MKELFVPKEGIKESIENLRAKSEQALLIAVGNTIYAILGIETKNLEYKLLKKRNKEIKTICMHNDELYDAGDSELVYKTFIDKEITARPGTITSLLSFNGNLYDAGRYERIIDVASGNSLHGEKHLSVTAMSEYNGRLAFVKNTKDYAGIWSVGIDKKVNREFVVQYPITDICNYQGDLYFAYGESGGPYGISKLSTKKHMKRAAFVETIFKHNYGLYDLEQFCINRTPNDKIVHVIDSKIVPVGKQVNKIISVKKELIEDYL